MIDIERIDDDLYMLTIKENQIKLNGDELDMLSFFIDNYFFDMAVEELDTGFGEDE